MVACLEGNMVNTGIKYQRSKGQQEGLTLFSVGGPPNNGVPQFLMLGLEAVILSPMVSQ